MAKVMKSVILKNPKQVVIDNVEKSVSYKVKNKKGKIVAVGFIYETDYDYPTSIQVLVWEGNKLEVTGPAKVEKVGACTFLEGCPATEFEIIAIKKGSKKK